MKKEYRKALYYSIAGMWFAIWFPLFVLGIIGEYSARLLEWLCRILPADWLKTKFRVYDNDPD